MSNEKQNKGWKEALLTWEKAGGHPEKKGDLWERLEAKLESRRPKRTYFLWAAAIFLPVAGSFLFLQKKPAAAIKPGQPAQAIHIEPSIKEKKDAEPFPLVTAAAPHPVKNRTIRLNPSPASVPADSPAVIDEKPLNPDTAMLITHQPVDPTPQVIPLQPSKKIRIVHLNEWNAPPPPTYATLKESWDKTQLHTDNDPLPERSVWPGKNRNKTPASSAN